MKSYLLAVVLLALCVASVRAQSIYYVDPAAGSNVADGSQATPFKSLTFALTQTVAGDDIILRAGLYSTDETFPILLKNQVDIDIFGTEEPVFDGGGSGTLFRLGQNISASTLLRGLTLSSCQVGLDIPSGASVAGLVVQECRFSGFADSVVGAQNGFGILAVLSSGGASESLTIDRCSFSGAGAMAGIALEVTNNTTLAAGGVLANTSTGGVDRTLWMIASDGGSVASSFEVNDNVFAGYNEAGMYWYALGSGAMLSTSTIACQANGNSLTGSGIGAETGLFMRAQHGALNQNAVISSAIRYGLYIDNYVNVFCDAINNGASVVDIVPDFYANRIENATWAGVEMTILVPAVGNNNNDPDFGPGHAGNNAALNTFRGNAVDFRIGAGITNVVSARFNFFPAGGATRVGGVPNTSGIMSETIRGGFESRFEPDTAGEIRLLATTDSGFVHYSGNTLVGQAVVNVAGSVLDPADVTELTLGGGLLLNLPALPAGNRTVVVTNPGGQTGTFTLNVAAASSGSDSSAGNDCFVATAAHGNYRSREVIALRRFRDQYLMATPQGQRFVDWYYANGPKGAAFILQHEWARKTTRAALVVPVAIAQGVTSWNPGQRFAVGVLLLGLVFGLTRRRSCL